MSVQVLTQYFTQYGAVFVFVIVLLEYMNLPGFPAGVIMPLAGIWAARGEISFPLVLLISVGAGLAGSWVLYFLGRLGGQKLLGFYFKKFPKQRPLIEDKIKMLREKGYDKRIISEKMGVAPFIAGKYMDQAARFKRSVLRRALEDCVKAEEDVKTGKVGDVMSVELLMIKYSSIA